MDEATVLARFRVALEALEVNDAYLLEYDLSERTIMGKLQVYLHGVFPSHHVDIEYNKHGVDVKRVRWSDDCTESDQPLVYPDIVVHRRGSDEHNLVVCEIKKASTRDRLRECDRAKVTAIRSAFDYDYALLLTIPVGSLRGESTANIEIVSRRF